MIYTSYFANWRNVHNPISICGKCPDWYTGPQFKTLAPKFWFFDKYKKGEYTKEEYITYYYAEVLDKFLPFAIEQQLKNIYPDEEDVTLLCYEKPTDFCHRHIVAEWFNKAGVECKELG